jgi:hypothetical protein
MPAPPGQRCRIRLKGQLNPTWSAWFDGLAVTPEPNGETTISGQVPDQAALHGLLAKVRDLGLTIMSISIEQLAP